MNSATPKPLPADPNPKPSRCRPWWLRRVSAWALAVGWVVAFVGTHTPARRLPTLPTTDVVLHMAGYFVLTALFLAARTAAGAGRARRVLAVGLILPAYGAFDELTQELVGRYAAWGDWFADLAGVAAGVLVWEAALLIAGVGRGGDAR